MISGPRDEVYDAVVVGTGLGGVSAAALLAKAGQKVLAVERLDDAGGCTHAFRRGPYLFDPAIHILEEGKEGRFVDILLRYLVVRDQCDLIRVDHLYKTALPGFSLHVPPGHEEIIAAHVELFPHEAEAIRRFFELHARFFREATHVSMQLSVRNLDEAVERFPTFFAYRNATLGAVLDEYFVDPRVKAVCSSMWPYIGLPPSRLSFYFFSQFPSVLIDGGSYYCRGSFQRLADAFVTALERNGGELAVGCEVERILVRDGRVEGVRLTDGREIRAGTVISNADVTFTFEDLVGPEHLPEWLVRRVRRMEPSTSAVVVYAATGLDLATLEPAHEAFLYRHWDHDATYRDILRRPPGRNVGEHPDPRRSVACAQWRAPRHPHLARAVSRRRAVARDEGPLHRRGPDSVRDDDRQRTRSR